MKAVVSGSTGFIGTLLLEILEKDDSFDYVSVLSRRPLNLNSKFQVLIGDYKSIQLPTTDVAFCALGTTIAVAGSKDAFYHVDHNLVIKFATMAKASGAKTFVVVSSVGADAKSSNFYLKVKGETENDLKALGFESLVILRPSMLLGNRKEFRIGELIGKGVMTVLNPLMLGPFAKYKGIQGKTVAKAMVRLSKETFFGNHVLEYNQLQAFD